MAWRIHDSVKRGVVDNRERGLVRGRVWLHGIDEPMILELKGNACPDLAGCLLTFENPGKTIPVPADARMGLLQRGVAGDMTASCKVRVFEMPDEKACLRKKQGLPLAEKMANCLYLEWFSEANWRVVIQNVNFRLAISPAAWRLSDAEELQRQEAAAEAYARFLAAATKALGSGSNHSWKELGYEEFLRRLERRKRRYTALLEKYRHHPRRNRLIALQMSWASPDKALVKEQLCQLFQDMEPGPTTGDPPDGQQLAGDNTSDELPDPDPECGLEGIDWVRSEFGSIRHPLALRVFDNSHDLGEECSDLGLDEIDDADLDALVGQYQSASLGLGLALDGLACGDPAPGEVMAEFLSDALDHLQAAEVGMENVAPKKLLPSETITRTRAELCSAREEMLRLIRELYGWPAAPET